MITTEQIREVKRLHALGQSHKEIERRSGVGQTTIGKILNGKRTENTKYDLNREQRRNDEDERYPRISSYAVYARCHGCGGLQQTRVECLVCKTRNRQLLARFTRPVAARG